MPHSPTVAEHTCNQVNRTYLECVCCVSVWCRYPHCIRGHYTDVHHHFAWRNVLLLFWLRWIKEWVNRFMLHRKYAEIL